MKEVDANDITLFLNLSSVGKPEIDTTSAPSLSFGNSLSHSSNEVSTVGKDSFASVIIDLNIIFDSKKFLISFIFIYIINLTFIFYKLCIIMFITII